MKAIQLYEQAIAAAGPMAEHLPVLYKYASAVERVTEFGTGDCASTAAFLLAEPRRLTTYDIVKSPGLPDIEAAVKETHTRFEAIMADVLKVGILDTDLLLLDTIHTYEQVRDELFRHQAFVGRYIILHDTETFGIKGWCDTRGIWPAVSQFLRGAPLWRLHAHYVNGNGLTILERCG